MNSRKIGPTLLGAQKKKSPPSLMFHLFTFEEGWEGLSTLPSRSLHILEKFHQLHLAQFGFADEPLDLLDLAQGLAPDLGLEVLMRRGDLGFRNPFVADFAEAGPDAGLELNDGGPSCHRQQNRGGPQLFRLRYRLGEHHVHLDGARRTLFPGWGKSRFDFVRFHSITFHVSCFQEHPRRTGLLTIICQQKHDTHFLRGELCYFNMTALSRGGVKGRALPPIYLLP